MVGVREGREETSMERGSTRSGMFSDVQVSTSMSFNLAAKKK